MNRVMITIEEPIMGDDGITKIIRKTPIVPEMAIPNYQRIFGSNYKGAVIVDDEGVPIKDRKPSASPREAAFNAMKERAKTLKIKGYQVMNEDTLLKAIQAAANKK